MWPNLQPPPPPPPAPSSPARFGRVRTCCCVFVSCASRWCRRASRWCSYGIKEFAKGDRHEGMYMDDKRNGWGKYVWANGDKYIGEWFQVSGARVLMCPSEGCHANVVCCEKRRHRQCPARTH